MSLLSGLLLGVMFVSVTTLIAWGTALLVCDYREDRDYQPRHAGLVAWSPRELPPSGTVWDVPVVVRAEINVVMLVRAADLAAAGLRPGWAAERAAALALEYLEVAA